MDGIYILKDSNPVLTQIINDLSIPEKQIFSYTIFEHQKDCHDWSTNQLKGKSVKKIIIPLSLSFQNDSPINTEGLNIALNIRLNYELSKQERLTPIILLSDFDFENTLKINHFNNESNPQNLLFTKGVELSSFDSEEIEQKLSKTNVFLDNEYFNILNKLKIISKAQIGKHSIANAWGCFKLAQAIEYGFEKEIFKNDNIVSHLKSIYAKYLICQNESYQINKNFIDLNPLKCNNKKILFIDDQADEGWSIIMKRVFSNAEITIIDSAKYKNSDTKLFHDFNGFYADCQAQIGKAWDLILIDLRLHPEEEDLDQQTVNPKEFKGYKLIKQFFEKNPGYQIMLTTASNKIWNINSVLDLGVSSFYIKESPEYNFTISDTKKHYEIFKENVQNCFDRNYLRKIYDEIESLKIKIDCSTCQTDFKDLIKNQFDLSYNMLLVASSKQQFAFAYITLYMIIELINEEFVSSESVTESDNQFKRWKIENQPLKDWKFVSGQYIAEIDSSVKGNKPPEWQKMAGLYFQKWNQNDQAFINEIYHLIEKRNGFIHNKKVILDKRDRNGYLNHDIYEYSGFEKLLDSITKIINWL